jgi:peptidoglycan biosynthesis protein MviN/MurJ (putative lipid II flippase)
MTLNQVRPVFIYYFLNILAVTVAVLLLKSFYGTQDFKESISNACMTSLITLPVFHKQSLQNKGILLGSVIASFVIPFIIFFIWNWTK